MNNYGYQNELDFVKLFNKKQLNDLDDNSKKFLKDLFGDFIDNDEQIISWKNKDTQKADIFIKYKNVVKSISLKCGNSNSIHSESLQDFRRYLVKLNIPYKTIDKYVSYHYGYFRNKDGNTDFSRPLSADEYKTFYQNEIDEFNKSINKTRIIIDMVERFLIRGKNSDYDIDALVSGKIDDYVWILKYDLYDLILAKRNNTYTSPHSSCITIGPKARCLNGNTERMKDRYIVCARWNFIRESIEEFNKNNY